MNIKSKVIESVRWLFVAQLFSQLVRTGVTIYVIRELESEHMAFVAMAQTVIGFMELFSSLGLGAAIVSKHNLTAKDLSNIAGMVLAVNLSLACAVFLLSDVFAQFYGTPEISAILKVLSLGFVISAFSTVPSALLTKEMRFREISLIQVVASVAGAITSFILVTRGYLYWSIVFGGVAFMGTRVLLINIVNARFIFPRFSFSESIRHIAFGGFVTLYGISWYLYTTLDVIIAGRLWEPQVLGLYAVAVQLTVIPLTKISPLLKQVAFPAYSLTLVQDAHKLEHYLSRSVKVSMGVCFPVYFGISCISFVFVPTVLGDEWQGAALPLMYLCLAAPFRFLLEMVDPAVVAYRRPDVIFYNDFLILVVMVCGFYFVTSYSSEPAFLALVWTLLFPLLSLFATYNFCKAMKVKYMSVVNGIISPFLISASMWLVVYTFTRSFGDYMGAVSLLISAIFLGAIVYCALVLMLDRNLLEIYKGLLRRDESLIEKI